MTFTCSICGEASRDICHSCTKDTCANHLCERCRQCSDCCVCEVRLVSEAPRTNGMAAHVELLDEMLPASVHSLANGFESAN